ncbi:hypothetical protein AHAS_Ahas04G0099400 [Arachis hypogaea]
MQDYSQVSQNDPHSDEFNNYPSCGWEDQIQRAFISPYSTYQEPSSLEQTFNSFMQNCPILPPSFSIEISSSLDYASTQNSFQNSQHTQTFLNQRLLKLESMLERYEEETRKYWEEQETSFKNMEVLLDQMLSIKEEVEEEDEEDPVPSETLMKKEVVE